MTSTASNQNITKATTDAVSGIEKLNKAFSKTVKIGLAYASIKKVVSLASDFASEYIDAIETQNLFETQIKNITDEYGNLLTASSNYYDRAIAFQEELNQKLYTNMSEMMEYQALFYSMFESQDIGEETSYRLSENLTKAGIDIASLFNLEVDEAMDKLKSGIAGQVEPLRQIGIDISESSLQTVLDNLGIDRTVQELSYAEKEIVRYIAIVNQAGEAQGDFAKTFNQPANQIKMLSNQLSELRQVIGKFVVNAFGGIIKYALAAVIAVKNVLNAIGKLFGWELSTDTSSTSVDISDSVGADDLADDLDSATSSAKALKRQLMGFDEINNITDNTSSSGSSGSSSSVNGIDSALLDALEDWDLALESINDEISELVEKIEGKLMSAVNWLRDNWDTVLEVIKAIGVALLSWKIAKTVTDFLENLGLIAKGNSFGYAFDIMLTITGIYLMYQGLKKLLNGEVSWTSIIETLVGFGLIAVGIADFLRRGKLVTTFTEGLTYSFPIALSIASFMIAYNGIKAIMEGNADFLDYVQAVVGTSVGLVSGGTSIWKIIQKLKTSDFVVNHSGALQFGFNIGLAIGSLLLIYNSVQRVIDGESNFLDALAIIVGSGILVVSAGKTIWQVLQKLKTSNFQVSFSNNLQYVFGIAAVLSGLMLTYNGISKIISGDSNILDVLETIGGNILTGIGIFTLLKKASIGGSLGNIGTATIAIGLTVLFDSITYSYEDGKEIAAENGSINIDDILGTSTLTSAGSGAVIGATIGSIIPGVGTVLGAIAGGLLGGSSQISSTLIGAAEGLSEYAEAVNQVTVAQDAMKESLDSISESYQSTVDSINSAKEATLVELDVCQELTNSLGDLVDSNGRVIAGNEDRVDYILGELNSALGTELTRNGDLIYNNGEVVTSYEDLQSAISDTIAAKKKEAETEAYMELYKADLQARVEAQREYTESLEETKKAYEKWQEAEASGDTELAQQYKQEWFDLQQATQDAYEDMEYYTQKMAEDSIYAFGEITASAIENGELTAEALQSAVSEAPETWSEAYASMEASTQSLMLGMSTTIDNFSSELQEEWIEMASSPQQFVDALVETDEQTQELITSTILTVENMTPDMVMAWATMADENVAQYTELLSMLPEDTQEVLENAINKVEEYTPSAMQAWADLAENSESKYNYTISLLDDDTQAALDEVVTQINNGSITAEEASQIMGEKVWTAFQEQISNLDDTTSEEVSKATSVINGNTTVYNSANTLGSEALTAYSSQVEQLDDKTSTEISNVSSKFNSDSTVSSAAGMLGSNANTSFSSNLGSGDSIATNFVTGFTSKISSLVSSVKTSVGNLASSALTKLKSVLGIASPSKRTAEVGEYFVEGFGNVIDEMMPNIVQDIGRYAQEITDNFADNVNIADTLSESMRVDENAIKSDIDSILNNGSINSQFESQLKFTIDSDDIANKIAEANYDAFVRAMQDQGVNVEIEAKTDEGTIVKKVSSGVQDYVRRTGKMPFPVVVG